jgi:hypothetical protein
MYWQEVNGETNVVQFAPDGNLFPGNHWFLYQYQKYRVISDKQIEVIGPKGSAIITYAFTPKLELYYTCREKCGDRFVLQ